MGNSLALDDRRSGPEDRRELPRENEGRRASDKKRKTPERQPKVRCTHCGHADSLVVDGWEDWGCYIRRRKCQTCGQNFHTKETAMD